MPTPAFGSTNAILPGGQADVNPFAATAAPNNGGAAPAPTDTSASPASTSTSAPPATPTAVVSSQPAEDQLTQAQQTVDASSAAAAAAANAKVANANQPGYDQFGNPLPKTPVSTSTPSTTQTPEEQIASQPEPGNQFIYDADGNPHQIPIGDPIPAGYTSNNPTIAPTTPVTGTTQSNAFVYKQFSDGTYGKFSLPDNNGNSTYQGVAQASDYQNAQAFQTATASLATVMNGGSLPLTPDQVQAVAALQASWNQQISQQETMNANNMGGNAILNNLRGISGDSVALAATAQNITAGANAIADLQQKAAEAIATMEDGFETNNLTSLKDAMDSYEAIQTQWQTTIKDMQTTLDAAQKVQNAAIDQATIDTQIGNQIAKGVTDPNAILAALTAGGLSITAKQVSDTLVNLTPNATAIKDLMATAAANGAPSSVLQAIGTSTDLATAYAAAGQYGAGGTGIIGEYNAAQAQGYTGTLTDFMNASNAAKSQGTATGKANATTSASNNYEVTIPQAAGTSSNQYAYQNNNPGNLKFNNQAGATLGAGGFAKFDTAADGYAALIADITAKMTGGTNGLTPSNTLQDMINIYAPDTIDPKTGKPENDPVAYAQFIAKNLRVSTTTQLNQLDPSTVAQQIALYESNTSVVSMGMPDSSITNPDTIQPNLGGLSLNGLDIAANNYITTKTMPSLGLGATGNVIVARLAVINRAGDLAKGNATMTQSLYAANAAEQKNIGIKLAATTASQQTANDNLNLALQASNALPRGGASLTNNYVQWAQGNLTTNTGLTQLEVYVYTAAREYAKVTSGAAASTQGLTDTATAAAGTLLSAAQSPANFQAAVTAMQNDMANVVTEQTTEQTNITTAIGNLTSPTTQTVVQNQQDTVSSINTFVNQSQTNATAYQNLMTKFPNFTPEQAAAALGISQ